MIRTMREINSGKKLPPFYYGLSYIRYDTYVEIWHIIPLNYFIRWGRVIRFMWDSMRAQSSRIDNMFAKVEREAEHRGYNRAFANFMTTLDKNMDKKIKENKDEQC